MDCILIAGCITIGFLATNKKIVNLVSNNLRKETSNLFAKVTKGSFIITNLTNDSHQAVVFIVVSDKIKVNVQDFFWC